MKQISHFAKFISVRVCVFWKENGDEKSAIFITSISVRICAFSEKSKDKYSDILRWKNQPFCKIHICACVRVLKRKCGWKIGHLYNIDICACMRLFRKPQEFRHFEMKQISHFAKFISVRVCVFWKENGDE